MKVRYETTQGLKGEIHVDNKFGNDLEKTVIEFLEKQHGGEHSMKEVVKVG